MSKETPPPLFHLIQDDLFALNDALKRAQSAGHNNQRLSESLWPIMRLHHERTRLVYDAFLGDVIDQPVVDYCIKRGWADKGLLGKWRKPGFGKLCCVLCVQAGRTCICRVPVKDRVGGEGKVVECEHCGCRGCAGG